MRLTFVTFLIVSFLASSGCGSSNRVEIPTHPVPRPENPVGLEEANDAKAPPLQPPSKKRATPPITSQY